MWGLFVCLLTRELLWIPEITGVDVPSGLLYIHYYARWIGLLLENYALAWNLKEKIKKKRKFIINIIRQKLVHKALINKLKNEHILFKSNIFNIINIINALSFFDKKFSSFIARARRLLPRPYPCYGCIYICEVNV